MITRSAEKDILELANYFPCIAIVGPRQVGKTTLIKMIREKLDKPSIYLDLETISDYSKLADPETYLREQQDKTVIIDEVQRLPGLFPLLRALIDLKKEPARFILLGSAGPDLVRDSSESLAGRIAYLELAPFILEEIIKEHTMRDLWLYGGFPDAFLHHAPWQIWMNNFVKTYLERDLPNLGFPADPIKAERLWIMLAHFHGNIINYSDLSKSLELSSVTVKKYIDFLEKAFLVRQLRPYTMNLKKRLVKSPKIYIRDSGVFHYLLGIESFEDLISNPKMGSSWEGFVVDQISAKLKVGRRLFFYRTHDGSEIDLVIEKGGKPLAAIEIKYGSDIRPNKGNLLAIQNLGSTFNFIITAEGDEYNLSSGFRVCSLQIFLQDHLPGL
ncbi:MAG TPA: ATP-binding protein [Bacteroidales bacterium]|nr:ATP-binding protein [Bacteroidales bacterium]